MPAVAGVKMQARVTGIAELLHLRRFRLKFSAGQIAPIHAPGRVEVTRMFQKAVCHGIPVFNDLRDAGAQEQDTQRM